MNMANGSTVNVKSKTLDRLGVETGVGLTANITENWEFNVGYEGRFRNDYQDHTGLASIKFNF